MAVRKLALLMCLALVGAACGARLSDAERVAGIRAMAGAGTSDGDVNTNVAVGDQSVGDITATPGDVTTDDVGGTGQTGTAAQTPTGGTKTGGSGAAGSPAAAKCKAGPVSETGISDKQVTIAVASDITGPSPGLFKSTHEAVGAYANYINSKGGVCGRQVKVLKLDTKTESGGNRAAVLDACGKAFAMVGSMSAFDDGGAQAVDECKIPDISAIPTSPERIQAAWTLPVNPNRQDVLAVGQSTYIKNTFGEATIKKAAILWLNATVTRNNATARKNAWKTVGYEFIYEKEVQVLEANYTPFIQDMSEAGIEYVTMVGDNNSIARLLKAAKQQDWAPKVWDWDSVAYDPGFVELAGDAAEGSYVFVNTKMIEEGAANPEMALYSEWLAKSSPGAEPDYFGIYAWSAAALFADTMVALGPSPTRQALLDKLKGTPEWDGHGIHGSQGIGSKTPTTCFLYMKITGGKFQRNHPAGVNTQDCTLAGRVQV